MGSMRPPGRFLSFASNIQRTQKQPVPSGFPQSLSGSETDVSTSNENLSREERYVVRHTARVEPQGQENQTQANNNRNSLKDSVSGSNRNSLKDSVGGSNSNRSSLDVSSSSYNTLIIHNQDDSWPSRPTPIREHERTSSEIKHSPSQSSPYHTLKKSDGSKKPSGIPLPKVHKEQPISGTANYIDIGGQRIYTSPPDQGVQEITEIPDDFLNQSSVLKHLAKEVAQSPTPRGPTPPASPLSVRCSSKPREERKGKGSKAKLSKEKLSLSRSQPDLTSVGVRGVPGGSESSGWCSGEGEAEGEAEEDAFAAVLDTLAAENHQLKRQLADACGRLAKTNKLEEEVEKIRSAHSELVGSCERRERLERAARTRLQTDCRRLHDLNRALKHQVELLSQGVRTESDGNAESLRKELQNREMLIAQLITQNKELACAKERQEIEMSAQRATLQEQRTHIDILDTALTNAQANVVRLEEECRHASGYVDRVMGLQRALGSLQQASDRREHTERKLRAQLEKELQALRQRECSCGAGAGAGGGAEGGAAELRRQLRERDERLLALEGECAKWEQRYLEEAALRQAAVSAASIPKDAKIAALEKTSADAERLMAEARSEKIRHMDELHLAQKKVADLESRVKELESKVAERDAMIKVLQKHTSGASLRNNSSREELVGLSPGASFSSAEGSGGRYRHLARRNYSPHRDNASGCAFDSSSLRLETRLDGRLEEQLAALESRLERPPVPARGLCCFPGLGGVGARAGRGEEALLLERQGRASQQTRSSSLPPPPSALPRPPRKPSARAARYDRLDHRDARKDSDGSGSIASTASRSSPLPYDAVRSKLPSVPTSASLPAAESRESLVRPRDSSLPSPSKLAVYAAARRRSAESAKDNKRAHHYRIQF
ncbi:angiomotin-like protein 2 [Aricia agestis]|uniref:angiomotin-like protein 2 n=1 Tax=Aricia agestis TaxID=91739 RepID=UPI001C20A0FE|nr:angiomotin-like protein 2 [Aricia agestis]XP_041971295.1 angiomotin-like protein 2 [Aricia agestis]